MADWERRRILIWGKTRPELSKSYKEVVCTGGVFEDTRRLVRLYPIPLRYMDDEKIFKKYQWIEASVTRSAQDPRPESYKIRPEGIEVLDQVRSRAGDWGARAPWVLHSENIFQSVEALQQRQKEDHTSLGLIKPVSISDFMAERLGDREKAGILERWTECVRQTDLPFDPDSTREVEPLKAPDFRFKIRFRCDDELCRQEHVFSVLDWEVDALYFTLRKRGDTPDESARKVVDKLRDSCAPDKDLYFFLGNISTHPQVFTIVGLWRPKLMPQLKLPLT